MQSTTVFNTPLFALFSSLSSLLFPVHTFPASVLPIHPFPHMCANVHSFFFALKLFTTSWPFAPKYFSGCLNFDNVETFEEYNPCAFLNRMVSCQLCLMSSQLDSNFVFIDRIFCTSLIMFILAIQWSRHGPISPLYSYSFPLTTNKQSVGFFFSFSIFLGSSGRRVNIEKC